MYIIIYLFILPSLLNLNSVQFPYNIDLGIHTHTFYLYFYYIYFL